MFDLMFASTGKNIWQGLHMRTDVAISSIALKDTHFTLINVFLTEVVR